MSSKNFHVDFESNVPEFDTVFKMAAEKRLRTIAMPHNEIDHATILVTTANEDKKLAQFQTQVIISARPKDLEVTESDYRLVEALDKALAEIERQIHERY
jgi:ribosome-associated translation inhibitor RaiA